MRNLIYSSFSRYRDLERWLDDRVQSGSLSTGAGAWAPSVDIREDENAFRIQADLPGIDPADVNLTIENNVLTISGTRQTEKETEEGGFKRRERFSGSFSRQFSLPESTDADAITARADKGVLEITIPKRGAASPRSIAVES